MFNNKEQVRMIASTAAVLIALPALLSGAMTVDFFGKALGTADGWLSYWGGYLGALIGLAAIAITTHMQINTQKNLQTKELEAQKESMKQMHKSQKEIQEQSIKQSSEANDRKERDRIYTDLLLKKNEELIELLVELNDLNTERFNLLNEYTDWQAILVELETEIGKRFKSQILSQSREAGELDYGKERQRKRRDVISQVDRIKDRETELRIKIQSVSAKLKSKSMYFEDLVDRIDRYRRQISLASEEFYLHIEKEDINIKDLKRKVEEHATDLHDMTNKMLGKCQENLLNLVKTLKEG